MNINASRLASNFETLSQYGKIGDTGVCRPTLSEIEKEAFGAVGEWMREAGMSVHIDHFGNLIGRLEGKRTDGPILMIGSHLDSQPYGGRFDGVSGVLAGVEVVMSITEQGIIPEVPIEVVSFSDEESWRFKKGLFGSRGIAGQLEPGELSRTDKDGISREQALRNFGCNPDLVHESVYPPGKIGAYFELHIEQGPVLESLKQPLGIVTGIAGPAWFTVTLEGFSGHAGSVPMPLRQDALLGAAEVILAVNRIVRQEPESPTVGTVGSLRVFPDSPNIIPEIVEFTVDLRDVDKARRDRCELQIRNVIAEVATRYHLTFSIRQDMKNDPRYCTEWMMEILRKEVSEMNLSCPELMSGPFHDAVIISYLADFAMIFVRCKDGISHNPAEFATYEDLSLGTELLFRATLRTTKELEEKAMGVS
ncbi:MAG: M20 family metallo-hydrolase [Bacilli bacterium]